MVGSPVRQCLNDGSWSAANFNCQPTLPVGCGDPVCPPNSYIAVAPVKQNGAYSIGDVLVFACNNGFEPSGNCNVRCQPGGIWTVTDFTCSRAQSMLNQRQCQAPDLPNHSMVLNERAVIGTTHNVGDSVQYGCAEGYTIFGTTQCASDGSWTSKSMACQPNSRGFLTIGGSRSNRMKQFQHSICNAPQSPTNASPISTSRVFTVGDFVQFACDPGYEVTGVVTCLRDGTWSAAQFKCKQATFSGASIFGSRTVVEPPRTSLSNNDGTNGRFSGLIPNLMALSGKQGRCETPATPENSQIVGKSVPVQGESRYAAGSFFIFHCKSGYRLLGDAAVTCQIDGNWTPSPVCMSARWKKAPLLN